MTVPFWNENKAENWTKKKSSGKTCQRSPNILVNQRRQKRKVGKKHEVPRWKDVRKFSFPDLPRRQVWTWRVCPARRKTSFLGCGNRAAGVFHVIQFELVDKPRGDSKFLKRSPKAKKNNNLKTPPTTLTGVG